MDSMMMVMEVIPCPLGNSPSRVENISTYTVSETPSLYSQYNTKYKTSIQQRAREPKGKQDYIIRVNSINIAHNLE